MTPTQSMLHALANAGAVIIILTVGICLFVASWPIIARWLDGR